MSVSTRAKVSQKGVRLSMPSSGGGVKLIAVRACLAGRAAKTSECDSCRSLGESSDSSVRTTMQRSSSSVTTGPIVKPCPRCSATSLRRSPQTMGSRTPRASKPCCAEMPSTAYAGRRMCRAEGTATPRSGSDRSSSGVRPQDLAQEVGLAAVALEHGVALAVAVGDPAGAEELAAADEDLDRPGALLRAADRVPQHVLRPLPPVHRDELHPG